MSAPADGQKLNVLIAHASADAGFAGELVEGLNFDGRFSASIADASIGEGEDSKHRRGDLIAGADIIIFVLSPEAIQSPVFTWEAEYARELSKLVRPVLVKSLDGADAPAGLADLDEVHFDGDRSFMEGLKTLAGSFQIEGGWLRNHTALTARARHWHQAGQAGEYLLTAHETTAAKNWTVDRPDNAPKPSDLQLAFISASETRASAPEHVISDPEASSPAPQASGDAPADVDNPQTLHKANRFYAVISILLAVVAAVAAWQAWEAQKRVAATDNDIKAQQQIAELSNVTLAIQKERIEEAIKTVNASLCTRTQEVTSTLATTSDIGVWDISYDVFWILHDGPMIALEQLHATLSETNTSPVVEAIMAFGTELGTKGEPYEARVPGLPRRTLLKQSNAIAAICQKTASKSN